MYVQPSYIKKNNDKLKENRLSFQDIRKLFKDRDQLQGFDINNAVIDEKNNSITLIYKSVHILFSKYGFLADLFQARF